MQAGVRLIMGGWLWNRDGTFDGANLDPRMRLATNLHSCAGYHNSDTNEVFLIAAKCREYL